jgi:hypothetical protein
MDELKRRCCPEQSCVIEKIATSEDKRHELSLTEGSIQIWEKPRYLL